MTEVARFSLWSRHCAVGSSKEFRQVTEKIAANCSVIRNVCWVLVFLCILHVVLLMRF